MTHPRMGYSKEIREELARRDRRIGCRLVTTLHPSLEVVINTLLEHQHPRVLLLSDELRSATELLRTAFPGLPSPPIPRCARTNLLPHPVGSRSNPCPSPRSDLILMLRYSTRALLLAMMATIAGVIIFRLATSSATRSQQLLAIGSGAAIAIFRGILPWRTARGCHTESAQHGAASF